MNKWEKTENRQKITVASRRDKQTERKDDNSKGEINIGTFFSYTEPIAPVG